MGVKPLTEGAVASPRKAALSGRVSGGGAACFQIALRNLVITVGVFVIAVAVAIACPPANGSHAM